MRDRVGAERSFVVRGGTVVTCDPHDRVLRADVAVVEGRFTAIGARVGRGLPEVDARDCIVLPGLVMAHVHLCQTLLRGAADDLPLLEWLRRRVWPLEAAHDARSLQASAELGLLELLAAGATTLLDLGTVHDYDVVFAAAERAGGRLIGGKVLMDRGVGAPRRLREPTSASLRSAEALAKRWGQHASGRLDFAWIPRFILTCSEALIRGAVERARAANALLHTHAAEHPAERAAVRAELGAQDVALLRRWGLHGPRASIAHGVALTPRELARLGADGTGVVHCPSANLKLGSGIADVAGMLEAGIVVGLGADGAPCNNNLDPWVELRHAALLASVRRAPGALPARAVLRLATCDGARLLGLADRIGSIEPSKEADLVVVRTRVPHVVPSPDPIGTLVYATQSRDVRDVWVAGRPIVRDGVVLTLDTERVVARAGEEARRLAHRAGC